MSGVAGPLVILEKVKVRHFSLTNLFSSPESLQIALDWLTHLCIGFGRGPNTRKL